MKTLLFLIFVFVICSSRGAWAQNSAIDISKIPITADVPAGFAPAGWKVEGIAKGDLNADGRADLAIKLIEDKGAEEKETPQPDRNRVMVVAFEVGGKLKRVAVADKLLQCTSCGGAFYGVLEAPASVSISKGVIVVEQEHGSREVSKSTFRFRHDASRGRFVLIGYDYSSYDRAAGGASAESTNYLTGLRITTIGNGKRNSKKQTSIKPPKIFLDDVDGDAIEYEAVQRLGLG